MRFLLFLELCLGVWRSESFTLTQPWSRTSTPRRCTQPHHELQESDEGIRLNKVFRSAYSRRQADKLVIEGRVTVNGERVGSDNRGLRIHEGDVVCLDGRVVSWQDEDNASKKEEHENIKYWKPVGVTSTTDRRVDSNILDAVLNSTPTGSERPIGKRIFTVGRLDRETTGLILLTSDGRVPNAVLRSAHQHSKTYQVTLNKPLTAKHAQRLETGVVITTEVVRNGIRKVNRNPTLPAKVSFLRNEVTITIMEGRNRQVRKMMKALGYTVKALHRVDFLGVTLKDLQGPGDWKRLDKHEMRLLMQAVESAESDPSR